MDRSRINILLLLNVRPALTWGGLIDKSLVDRLIQQALNQVINPIFDKEFSNSRHGFREILR